MKSKVEKACETVKNNLRDLYDYNLEELSHAIKEELEERKSKRAQMINSLEDMCKYMFQNRETSYTFYYRSLSPRELLEFAENDEITDEGYQNICQQLGEKRAKALKYGNQICTIKGYPQDNQGACFDVDVIEDIEIR